MSERMRSPSSAGYPYSSHNSSAKMATDLTPKKTLLILVIVVGCFAVLLPKLFYPMLVGSAEQQMKPSAIDKTTGIRQERSAHIKSEMLHPAFRERGRAIPQPQSQASPSRPPPRIVEGRPGPLPGMRPTIGGAGHVVPPPKQGTSSMSVIMPIYTIGIVIFFSYTLMKIIFKKQPDGVGGSLYPPVDPDPHFRREVFESDKSQLASRLARDGVTSKLGDLELDQLRRRLQETEQAMERIVAQMAKVPLKTQDEHLANGKISNGTAVKPHDDDQPSVTVMGMEMTASCEGGERWTGSDSPVRPHHVQVQSEPVIPPQEIFLEGALPAQSQLLVSDSATEAEQHSGEDPAVVLAGKMTLSVINVENEDNNDGTSIEASTDGKEDTEIRLKSSEEISNVFDIKPKAVEIPVAESLVVDNLSQELGETTLEPDDEIQNVFDGKHKGFEIPIAEPLIQKDQNEELITQSIESSLGDKEILTVEDDNEIQVQEVSKIQEPSLMEGEPKLDLEKQIDSLINEAKDIVLETVVSPSVDEFELLRESKERDVDKLLHEINDPIGIISHIKSPSDEQLLEDIADSVEVRNGNAHKELPERIGKMSQQVGELKGEVIDDVINSYNEAVDERSEANTLQEVSNIEDEAAPVDANRVIIEQVFQDKVDRLQTAPVLEEQKTDDEVIDSEEEVEYEEEEEEGEVQEVESEGEIEEHDLGHRVQAMPSTNQGNKVNGTTDLADESKYTNVSSTAMAEQDISERDRTDEEVEEDAEDEEIEEVVYEDEEEEEEEEEEGEEEDEEEEEQNEVHVNDERDDMNHIPHRSSDDE